MDVRDLGYFHAVLKAGSIVQAAEKVGRTPPALTKAVRRLEESLGTSLFARSGRGLVPTAAALMLAEQTRGFSERLASVRRDIAAVTNGETGHVRLGAAATMAAIYLPHLLERLSAVLPNVTVHIVPGMNDVLLKALRAGEIDMVIGIVEGPPDPELVTVGLGSDVVGPIASIHHRLQGHRVTMEELAKERWVLPARTVATRRWLDAAFIMHGWPVLSPQVETASISVLETLIADTDYVSFASGRKIRMKHLATLLRPLDVPDLQMHRELGAMRLSGPTTATIALIMRMIEADRSTQR